MDRLVLGYPNDDADVDALLSQLNDEHLMKLKVNSHISTKDIRVIGNGNNRNSMDDDAGVLDSHLSSRLAKLKADRPVPKSKGKETEVRKESSTGLSLRRSSSKREYGNADGSDKRRLSRCQSQNSEFLSCRSGIDNLDDPEDIDANLVARFRALKGTPSPISSTDSCSLAQFSRSLSYQAASNDDFYNSSYGSSSPSATLLGRSSSRSSPRVMTTSVATSCHCSTPSPFKLLKQLSSITFSPKSAALPLSPSSKTSTTPAKDQSPRDKKSMEKDSSKKKPQQKSVVGVEAENLSSVKDMKRLFSSVADRVGLERSRVSSAEEDDFLGGDLRAFPLLDRELEYIKVSSEEEKLNQEAERVVEWAKDAARLALDASDGEDEDLELGEEDFDSDSSTEKGIKNAKDLKKASKPKKKKKWGLF